MSIFSRLWRKQNILIQQPKIQIAKNDPKRVCRPLKILYLSCHEILEFDDLRMFIDSGHRVFSMGSFSDPNVREFKFRQPLPGFIDQELWSEFVEYGGDLVAKRAPRQFVSFFDVVIVNHYALWVRENLEAFAGKPIIIRTLGQSRLSMEREYNELGDSVYIVRYSYREAGLENFAKTDQVIYFGKYIDDYPEWSGGEGGLTFHNNYTARADISYPNLAMWKQFRSVTESRLYGAWNDDIEGSKGVAPDDEMLALYRKAAYYLYVYTHPPSYTLSPIEALMAGVPMLAPSASLIQSLATFNEDDAWISRRYEIPAFLNRGGGVVYNDVQEAIEAADQLSTNESFASAMSKQARLNAHSHFDAKMISRQWDEFFAKII